MRESLLAFTQNLFNSVSGGGQVDAMVFDFSKAFDTQNRLMAKLDFYGIRGDLHGWIRALLCNREQGLYLTEAHQHLNSSEVCLKVASVVQHCFYPFAMICHPMQNHLSASLLTTVSFIEKSDRVWMYYNCSPTTIICIVGNRSGSRTSNPTSRP